MKGNNCLNLPAGKEIVNVNSLGPFPLLVCLCVIHDGFVSPAYLARANDSRNCTCTAFLAPSLLRASIADEMWWEP